jgi:glycosyltransferase involved in cell wall biosynthesis
MNDIKPVISIVTVVLNNAAGFRITADSVAGLDYPFTEFIVIDGGSIDGTLRVIEEYASHIKIRVSEPDRGIYDAMNKGIRFATGEWIIFMNAGDVFANPGVLSRVFKGNRLNDDLIYGDSIADYTRFRILQKASPVNDLWKGMPFCHQAMLTRTTILKPHGFSLAYPIAADFDLVYRMHSAQRSFHHFPEPLCIIDVKGLSSQHYLQSWKERYTIYKTYGDNSAKGRLFYVRLWILFAFTRLLYNVLPQKQTDWIVKFRNRNNNVETGINIVNNEF